MTQRIAYDEPLLQGWLIRSESMDLESSLKIRALINEIYLLRADILHLREGLNKFAEDARKILEETNVE